MMRRKDFESLAEILRHYNVTDGLHDKTGFRDLVEDIADVCKKSNVSFDRSKFMKACGFYNY